MRLVALLLTLLLPFGTALAQRDPLPVADAYGYTVARSPAPACPANWIDTGAGSALSLTAAGVEAGADDDGGAVVALLLPFEFYGAAHSNLVVSSNGYLAFADDLAAEDGGHWRSDCPLPAIPDNTRARFARIHPLLADLERGASGDLRWQHFADCPRDAAQAGDACTVVTWLNWKRRGMVGVLDLQVVLYHSSGEIALQYGALDTIAAAGATVGIQDDGAASAAMPSCGNAAAPEASSAICFVPPSVAVPTFSIQTSALPAAGGNTSGDGTYALNATVTVTATPATGYGFVDWRENDVVQSTSASYFFAANADRSLVATFGLNQYTIAASPSPVQGGSVSGAGTYLHGDPVTLQATAATGYRFVDWRENDTVQSTSASYAFAAGADRALIATFALNQYTIAASSSPAQGGSVSGAGTYLHGDPVTLQATAATGYQFVDWRENDVLQSTSANYAFSAMSDRILVADFALNQYTIVTNAEPVQGGNVSGAGSYSHGQNVVLQATPASGYAFVNWTEGSAVLSTQPGLSFTADAARTLQANFVALPEGILADGFESPVTP